MCIMCDGASRDEALFSLHASVERRGWALQGVEGSERNEPWAYTIGLSDRFDHAELVMVGGELNVSGALLNAIADRIAEGVDIRPGMTVATTDSHRFEVATVHPNHFRNGTLAVWDEYYSSLGKSLPPAHAVEIVWPGRDPRLEIGTGFY